MPFNVIQPILKSKRKHSCSCKVAFSPHLSGKKLLSPSRCDSLVCWHFWYFLLVLSVPIWWPPERYTHSWRTAELIRSMGEITLGVQLKCTQHVLWKKKKKKEGGLSLYGLMASPIQNSRISYCIPSRPRQRWFLIKWVHLRMRCALHHPACVILETHDRF